MNLKRVTQSTIKKVAITVATTVAILAMVAAVTVLESAKAPPSSDSYTAAELLKINTLRITTSTMLGSGVFIGGNRVLSAAHVCEGANGDVSELTLEAYQGEIFKAKSYIVSEDDMNDICLIELDRDASLYLSGIQLADESVARTLLTTDVYAAGFVFGTLYAAKWGKVISEETIPIASEWGDISYLQVMGMSLSVIQGMSGGPVINEQKKLVGIIVITKNDGTSGMTSLKQILTFLHRQGE